jgi:hypothetical protein
MSIATAALATKTHTQDMPIDVQASTGGKGSGAPQQPAE